MKDIGKISITAILSAVAGIIGTVKFVEANAREEQEHDSTLRTHTEMLEAQRVRIWENAGNDASLERRVRSCEMWQSYRDGLESKD